MADTSKIRHDVDLEAEVHEARHDEKGGERENARPAQLSPQIDGRRLRGALAGTAALETPLRERGEQRPSGTSTTATPSTA